MNANQVNILNDLLQEFPANEIKELTDELVMNFFLNSDEIPQEMRYRLYTFKNAVNGLVDSHQPV